jgi:hypothetical protein
VPAVRFSRDKRGYEYVYLVHTPMRRGKPGRSRVLYWYRTPPGVRIGRKPFDEEVQRTVEAQNPGVTFDWEAIIATPMPPPDMTEFWRERRRAEKAARLERRAEELEGAALNGTDDVQSPDEAPIQLIESEASADFVEPVPDVPAERAPRSEVFGADQVQTGAPSGETRARRRRRRGRRRVGSTSGSAVGEAPSQAGAADEAADGDLDPDGPIDLDGAEPSDDDDPTSQ